MINTTVDGFTLRHAQVTDVPLILKFIRELAQYEQLLHEVVATEQDLEQSLFGERPAAEVVIGEFAGQAVSFALFFHNYSTFLGKPGLYLEDLYVTPAMRGKGLGKIMLAYLAHLAVQRNCGRFEWWVLDWNTSAIEFYHRLGAVPMSDWTVQRVHGSALQQLADSFQPVAAS